MKIDRKCIVSGATGGFLAGALLVVLFFFFDLARGEPLATPTFLSEALLGQQGVEAGSVRTILFTVTHFTAFVVLGILAAIVIDLTGIPRNIFVGAAYGLFVCSLVFYGTLLMSGIRILDAPGWPAVFFGNVLAGMVMVTYLRMAGPDEGVTGLLDLLAGHPIIKDGVLVGLLGAGVVALWFLIVDSVVGRPLFTPGALGSALLYGATGPDAVVVSAGSVIGYTLFHLAAFILFGLVVSALVAQTEKYPPLVFGLIILLVVFETFFVFMAAMLGAWILEALAWWSVLLGNVLAAVAIGAFIWKTHPTLRQQLRDDALWAQP
jgi:hypothetical protein